MIKQLKLNSFINVDNVEVNSGSYLGKFINFYSKTINVLYMEINYINYLYEFDEDRFWTKGVKYD